MSRLRSRDRESLVLVILTSFCPQLHHRNSDSSDPAWVISTTSTTYNILPGFRAPSPPAWDRSFFSLRTNPKSPHLASSMLTQHQNQAERVTQVGLGPKEYKLTTESAVSRKSRQTEQEENLSLQESFLSKPLHQLTPLTPALEGGQG